MEPQRPRFSLQIECGASVPFMSDKILGKQHHNMKKHHTGSEEGARNGLEDTPLRRASVPHEPQNAPQTTPPIYVKTSRQ